MATAADVPGTYDVVVNGQGYVFLDTLEPSLPFRTHKASYSLTPTFIARQNVSGDFGDNQQDFFLTFSQNDWSLGEQQRFFRTDDVRKRRYWQGTNLDVTSIEGQTTMRPGLVTNSTADAILSASGAGGNGVYFATTTKLYKASSTGMTNLGVHGLVGSGLAVVGDEANAYVSDGASVRKYNGSVWSTFSATGATALAFLNNTLYGFREGSNSDLVKWDAAGTLTSIYIWKLADGTTVGSSSTNVRLRVLGSRLLILRPEGEGLRSELWLYDGTGTAKVAEFPLNFRAWDFDVANGVAYVIGGDVQALSAKVTPVVYAYDPSSGTVTRIWTADGPALSSGTFATGGVASFQQGVIIADETRGALLYYNAVTGFLNTVADGLTASGAKATYMAGGRVGVGYKSQNSDTATYFFPGTATVSAATLTTSLVDFDSSLSKYFKAVKVDFDSASDGDGGSVDIAYQLNSVDGSFTSLQTGAAAGTEYAINQTGRSISIKVTLNKGTSTNGPKLKRIYLRAVPIQPQYRLRSYVLDVSGDRRKVGTEIKLRSGRFHTKDGAAMATDLLAAAAAQTPISITDRLGTYTGIIQADQFELLEIHPGQYVAQVVAREV